MFLMSEVPPVALERRWTGRRGRGCVRLSPGRSPERYTPRLPFTGASHVLASVGALGAPPPRRQPRGKKMVSLVNYHSNATSRRQHLLQICPWVASRVDPHIPAGWRDAPAGEAALTRPKPDPRPPYSSPSGTSLTCPLPRCAPRPANPERVLHISRHIGALLYHSPDSTTL